MAVPWDGEGSRRETRPRGPVATPLPFSLMTNYCGRKVVLNYWEGKSLKKAKGTLISFDQSGNVLLAATRGKKQTWFRGATIQCISIEGE